MDVMKMTAIGLPIKHINPDVQARSEQIQNTWPECLTKYRDSIKFQHDSSSFLVKLNDWLNTGKGDMPLS